MVKPTHNVVIVHTRPEYGPRVRFVKTYTVAVKPGQDLKALFTRAFKEAYPDRKLEEITIHERARA